MQIFGSNTPAIVQYLLAFVIILVALAVVAAVLRRITGNRPRFGYASSSARHRQQRLGVVDAVDIDSHRQLLLLRRDNVEHLVLIGGPNDLLVESGIGRLPYRVPAQHPPALDTQDGDPVRPDPITGIPAAAGIAAAAQSGAEALAQSADTGLPRPPRPLATPVAPRPETPASPLANPLASPPTKPDLPPLPEAFQGTDRPGAADQFRGRGARDEELTPAAGSRTDAPEPALTPEAEVRERPKAQSKGPFSAVARQLEEALKRPFGAVRPSPVTGIDLDETSAKTASGDGAGADAPTAGDAAATPPPPPVQAKLPLPPFAGERGTGAERLRPGAPSVADTRADTRADTGSGTRAGAVTADDAAPAEPGAGREPPVRVTEPAAPVAEILPREAEDKPSRPAPFGRGFDALFGSSPIARSPSASVPGSSGPASPVPGAPIPGVSAPSAPASGTSSVSTPAGRATPEPAAAPAPEVPFFPARPSVSAAPEIRGEGIVSQGIVSQGIASQGTASREAAPQEAAVKADTRPDTPPEVKSDVASAAKPDIRPEIKPEADTKSDTKSDIKSDTLKVPDALRTAPEAKREEPASSGSLDLSSLENIEAEFARLLGRAQSKQDS